MMANRADSTGTERAPRSQLRIDPMDPVIFLEKVRRPALRGLVRERLDRRTASLAGVGADPVSLALVLGPPGSGKTTLLSHIAEAAGDAAAWYRVGHRGRRRDRADPSPRAHARRRPARAGVIEAAAPGRIADLVRALDGPAIGPGQLIIDDLHEIAGTPAERALESFLSLRPRKIRIMLGSRRPPRINTSRMLVSGELTQLDGEDLRFRSWEVEELFRAVYDGPLSPEAAAALTRRTGGWAAGLQLFHLATAPAQPGRAGTGGRRAQRPVPADPLLPGPQRLGGPRSGAAGDSCCSPPRSAC